MGQRLIEMEDRLAEKEKFQGVLEMAGAVCHEMNQPLMAVSGYAEILLCDLSEDDPRYKRAQAIHKQVQRLGSITKKLMKITAYRTKKYLDGDIIDIDEASNVDMSEALK